MIKEERFKLILNSLNETGSITYADMSLKLAISEDTVRRDIDILHQNGLLSKVRGGAIPRNKNPLAFQDRMDHNTAEKEIIGFKVQPLLKKGMTIFMDGGTTICAVAERFAPDASFRVITNNLALIPILANFKNIQIIILGGAYNKDTQTNVGAKTCEDAEQFVADIYLMGTCAISREFGVTTPIQEDGMVKRSMLKGAKKVIVLSNSKKIGEQEFFKICDLDKISTLVSELPSDAAQLDEVRFLNLKMM